MWKGPHKSLVIRIPLTFGFIQQVISGDIDPDNSSGIVLSCLETFPRIRMQEFCINPTLSFEGRNIGLVLLSIFRILKFLKSYHHLIKKDPATLTYSMKISLNSGSSKAFLNLSTSSGEILRSFIIEVKSLTILNVNIRIKSK